MYTLYLAPGLASDRSVFSRLDLGNYPTQVIEWITPSPFDTIESYARKILPQIDGRRPIALLGVSFGGVIMAELARVIQPQRTIIISGAKKASEIPFGFGRSMNAIRTSSSLALWNYAKFIRPFFGDMEDYENSEVGETLRNAHPLFIQWAAKALFDWGRYTSLENVLHIHGEFDPVLPITSIRDAVIIRGGGHDVIQTHANEINLHLTAYLLNDAKQSA